MANKLILAAFLSLAALTSRSQEMDDLHSFIDSVEQALTYQSGTIQFDNGIGSLQVPPGFRYLDAQQSAYVIKDLWGNPEGEGTMGMIVPENTGLLADNSWAFILTYDEMGYVKDDDADDIDYDELLHNMQEEMAAENEQRQQAGYEQITVVGWAAKPFYDPTKKVLHWAKELKFGEADVNTLNYNIRVLGRKGVMVLNAVASVNELDEVKQNIEPVLASFTFSDGNRYADFNPDVDEVAAWTIGGLVAGKVLAKVGVLAFLLKYLKFIGIGLAAIGSGLWKWYRRKTSLPEVRNISDINS